jgi:hypothetical protein
MNHRAAPALVDETSLGVILISAPEDVRSPNCQEQARSTTRHPNSLCISMLTPQDWRNAPALPMELMRRGAFRVVAL